MGIYAQQKVAPKEESEATAQKPVATSGAKLTNLKTTKPVDVAPFGKADKTNQSDINEVKDKDGFDKIMKRRFANNFLMIYELQDNIENQHLPFGNDTNQEPINKIEVLSVGGGLRLWFNSNQYGITVSTGSIIQDVEIMRLGYQVLSGKATILVYSRID